MASANDPRGEEAVALAATISLAVLSATMTVLAIGG